MKWTFFACFSEKKSEEEEEEGQANAPCLLAREEKKCHHQGQQLWGPRALPFPCGVFSPLLLFFPFFFFFCRRFAATEWIFGLWDIFLFPSVSGCVLNLRPRVPSHNNHPPHIFFFPSFFSSFSDCTPCFVCIWNYWCTTAVHFADKLITFITNSTFWNKVEHCGGRF